MNLQKIKSLTGKDEYVLLPIAVYESLKQEIQSELAQPRSAPKEKEDYVPFILEDYVDNPVALARMRAHLTQKQLAERMAVTQAYISKIERQDTVSPSVLQRVTAAIRHKV